MVPAAMEIPLAPGLVSTQSAAMLGTQEDLCESGTRGHSGIEDVRRRRQLYATKKVQEWQRRHPTLPFADLLAFFRLAGKTFDRNNGPI